MGPSAGTFMRSTAAPKVENETPRFLVKSDSAFLRTRAAISELQVSELRDTQQRESQRSRKWITMSESKFRHKNFHQTHALQTRSFIRCNRFAAPVFFCFFCFWVSLSLEDAVAQLHATYRILETIQDCTNRRSPIQ